MSQLFNRCGYAVIAVIIVGISGFLSGGLAVHSVYKQREPADSVQLTPIMTSIPADRRVYASSSGKRYYPWWCDIGRIVPDNMVWFATPEDAKAEGYTIAKACEK